MASSRYTRLAVLAAVAVCPAARAADAVPVRPVRVVQPIHEYFTPFGPDAPAADRGTFAAAYTHLGTDYGPMGPAAGRVRWAAGGAARVDLRGADGWAGVWHSLAGPAADASATLDFLRPYPAWIRDAHQPRLVAAVVRAAGAGRLDLEITGADGHTLWADTVELAGGGPSERRFDLDPARLRAAKFFSWTAGPGAVAVVDAVGLEAEYPAAMTLPQRAFLVAYAKLARAAVPGTGLVRDHAHRPAGAFECVPAGGLYALATAAAADRGVVDPATAAGVLADARRAVAALPKADGWLPHFVAAGPGGGYAIVPGTEYSTVDTSITYHGLLLAARMLGDREAEAAVLRDVRLIRFDRVRRADGVTAFGLTDDGRTTLAGGWTGWGGEAALVVLLERMALGPAAEPRMSRSGRVPDGVGFVAELQSLFYPHFDRDGPDALTGVNWLAARRRLAAEQVAAVAADPAAAPAARLGLFGRSAGEGFRGRAYLADGLRGRPAVLHPHYVLMAGLSAADPAATWARVGAMEAAGLMPPWGLAENVTADLGEYLPVPGALNAAFEALSAYHLAARTEGRDDRVYRAARECPATAAAVELFYPRGRTGARSGGGPGAGVTGHPTGARAAEGGSTPAPGLTRETRSKRGGLIAKAAVKDLLCVSRGAYGEPSPGGSGSAASLDRGLFARGGITPPARPTTSVRPGSRRTPAAAG